MDKINELINLLKGLSNEEKLAIQEVLQPSSVNKKKRVVKKTPRKSKKKKALVILNDKSYENDPEVKTATKAQKLLEKNRIAVDTPQRPKSKIIKVKCGNCGKSYEVSAEIADNFICCHKRR